eukprot:527819_1
MSEQLSFFLSSVVVYSQIVVTISIKTYIIGHVDKMTWYSANDWCRDQGLDLASIHNDTEYNFIKSLLDQDQAAYWIGLTHTGAFNDTNAYSWTDNSLFDYGSVLKSTPWNHIEPNLSHSPSCVRLQDTTVPMYLWDDLDCNSTLNGHLAVPICQNITTHSPSLVSTTLTPTNNIQNTRVLSSSPTAYVDTLQFTVVFTTPQKDAHVIEASATTSIDLQEYAKHGMNDTFIAAHTYIIAAAASVCCMFIIGLILIKCARRKLRVSDHAYEKARISPSPMDAMKHQHQRDSKQHAQQMAHNVSKQHVVPKIASILHNEKESDSNSSDDSDSDGMYEVYNTKGVQYQSVDFIGPKVANNNQINNESAVVHLQAKKSENNYIRGEGSESLEGIGITVEGSGDDENVNPGIIGASTTQYVM